MLIIVAVLGSGITLIGLLGVAQPRVVIGAIEGIWESSDGLYLAAASRGVLAVIFILAAPASRFPMALYVLGGLALGTAIGLLIVGHERVQRLLEWWIARPDGFMRVWGLLAVAFGAFLVYVAV